MTTSTQVGERSVGNTISLPGINMVLVVPGFPDTRLRDTLIKAIKETSGIGPELRSDSESALRAHYAPAPSKLIINTASDEMHAKLGRHYAVPALEVDDVPAAAQKAAQIFIDAGYEATVDLKAEEEFPDNFLAFVKVPALEGIALMFWPRPAHVAGLPDYVKKSLPTRKPW